MVTGMLKVFCFYVVALHNPGDTSSFVSSFITSKFYNFPDVLR